jgi:hypothetical protein
VTRVVKQRDLFGGRPSRVPDAAQREQYVVEPFDDWDETRMVPKPDAKIPDECLIADLGEKA